MASSKTPERWVPKSPSLGTGGTKPEVNHTESYQNLAQIPSHFRGPGSQDSICSENGTPTESHSFVSSALGSPNISAESSIGGVRPETLVTWSTILICWGNPVDRKSMESVGAKRKEIRQEQMQISTMTGQEAQFQERFQERLMTNPWNHVENGQYLPRATNFDRNWETEESLDSLKMSVARTKARQEEEEWRQERRKEWEEKEKKEEIRGGRGEEEEEKGEGRQAPAPPRRWPRD